MNDLIIRTGNKEDIEKISELWVKMIKEYRVDCKPNTEWWKKQCYSLLNTKDIYFLVVAEIKDKIVGFIDAIVYPEPFDGKVHGIAQNFYILPEYRKTKVSPGLYRYMLKMGKQRKVQVIEFFCSEIDYWFKKGYGEGKVLLRRELCHS